MYHYKKNSIVTSILFVATITVSLISFISVIFPYLLIQSVSSFPNPSINQFEFGIWGIPVLISNSIFLTLIIFNKNEKIHRKFSSLFGPLFRFEISSKTALIIILILLGIYVIYSGDEFYREEFELGDYKKIKPDVENFDPVEKITQITRFFLLWSSLTVFDNIRIIPFLGSISLLILTYFFTKEITGKRFAGIISFVVLLQSNLFLIFDSTATYDNFWILFYLLSLYLILKLPYLSPVSFVLAILDKALIFLLFPVNFFIIIRSKISKKQKISLLISYGIIVLVGSLWFWQGLESRLGFSLENFWIGFVPFSLALRFDSVVLLFFIPTVVGLYLMAKRGYIKLEIVLFLIFMSLMLAPLISALPGYTNEVYRAIPIVVFFAIAVGTLFAKKS